MTTTEGQILDDLDDIMIALLGTDYDGTTYRDEALAGMFLALARTISHYSPTVAITAGSLVVGTDADRPTATDGVIRFNTDIGDDGGVEFALAGGWVTVATQDWADDNFQPLDVDLTAVAGLTGSGIPARISTGTWALRELEGTADEVTVDNGDGSGGNPTIGLADNPILPGAAAVTIPAGDTGARPGTPTVGMVRASTDVKPGTALEWWDVLTSSWLTVAGEAWTTSEIAAGLAGFVGTSSITTVGTITSGTWSGTTIAVNKGGTGLTSYTLGQILYASAGTTLTRLNGNTTAAQMVLSQTGTGAASAAPVWTASLAAFSITGTTTFGIKSAGANDLRITNGEAMTTHRTLTVRVNDADRILDLAGDVTLAGALTTSGVVIVGHHDTHLRTTAATDLTLPETGTVATIGNVETFTNKTLTSPAINGGTLLNIGTFGIASTVSGELRMRSTEALGGSRIITWNVNDANKNITLGGNITTGASWTMSGAFSFTGTVTGTTSVTFPTSGVLETTDTGITSLKGVDTAADIMPYTTGANAWAALTTTAGGRAALGVTYAADKGVYWTSASVAATFDLTAGARAALALTYAADKGVYWTSASASATFDLTAGGRAGLGLTYAADRGVYWTSASAAALFTFTAFGRSLVDDANAAAARTTLELEAGAAGDIWVEKAGDTMTGPLIFAAGTATAGSWSKLQSGTVLTTAAAGAQEYDGAALYFTSETTSGREQNVTEHVWRLTSNGGAIGAAIDDFFGANSSISLPASSMWELEADLYFTKTTSDTVTITVTNSAANFTNFSGCLEIDAVGGGTGFQTITRANIHNATGSAQAFPATGALTTATLHLFKLRCVFQMNAAGNIRIRVTSGSGTVTPRANSMYKIRRIPGNIGTFAA